MEQLPRSKAIQDEDFDEFGEVEYLVEEQSNDYLQIYTKRKSRQIPATYESVQHFNQAINSSSVNSVKLEESGACVQNYIARHPQEFEQFLMHSQQTIQSARQRTSQARLGTNRYSEPYFTAICPPICKA